MSCDPYHDFAADLRSSLSSARSLSQTYIDLVSSSSSSSSSSASARTTARTDDLQSAQDRLNDAIEGLRQDVEDVKQSVQVVERRGPERFGVTPEELENRKQFVRQCEDEIAQLSRTAEQRHSGQGSSGKRAPSSSGFQAIDMNDSDQGATEAFEREQQQMLMTRQDTTLDSIGATLLSLRSQAGTMGQEIGEQVELIGALDGEVEHSQGRLSKAMRQMDEVVRIGDERLGGWCVWILVVVLFILLLMVILI